ncbi:MAG: hypothetical protein H5T76_23390 [Streptomyces sp.]|nr:hypothetical protein [Streptomyces sp.]
MADARDFGTGCDPGCGRVGDETLWPYLGATARLVPVSGVNEPMSAHIGEANAIRLRIDGWPPYDDGCAGPPVFARLWGTTGYGTFTATGSLSHSGGGSNLVTVAFDCPVDLVWRPQSYQGGSERIEISTEIDELYRGAGTSLTPLPVGGNNSQESIPPPVTYRDNQGPSTLIFRQRTSITALFVGQGGLAAGTDMFVHMAPERFRPVRCDAFVVEDCTPGQAPRWRMGCAAFDDPGADFFTDFAPGLPWQYSSDGGSTWVPAPASAPHTAGDGAGQHRWRQQITIPVGYTGFWSVLERGPNFHGTMFLDGAVMADNQKTGSPNVTDGVGWSSGYAAVTPGPHVFEWREGAHTADGTTVPDLRGNLRGVRAIRDDVQVVECLDASGTVASSYLLDADGNPYTLAAAQSLSDGLCGGCP